MSTRPSTPSSGIRSSSSYPCSGRSRRSSSSDGSTKRSTRAWTCQRPGSTSRRLRERGCPRCRMGASIGKTHMSNAYHYAQAVTHPDLPAEQAYVDEAYDSLDRMREALLRAAEAGATEVAQQAIEDWANGRLRTYEDAERCLCYGRHAAE